ncbi:MAG: MarR family winged helix-turn-helix transcriptional regulator [Phenylobacterium sp.]
MAAAPEDHPDVAVFDEIGLIAYMVRSAIARKLPDGLNYPQFEVLNLLARRGDGMPPMQIAQALQIAKSGLTNTLQRLCAGGLILVETCEADGRRKRIWLTAEGRQAYARALVAIRPNMEHLRDGFTQKEFQEALPFLRALRRWLAEIPLAKAPVEA